MQEIQTRMWCEHRRLLQHDGLHADRCPQFRWLQLLFDSVKSLRHHTDHFKRSAVDRDGFSHDVLIGRKRLLPEVIAQHDNCAASWNSVVARYDGAAKKRVSAEEAEIIARDEIGRREQSVRIYVGTNGLDRPDTHLV